MTAYLLAGPAEEPLSLAETKAFLKLDDAVEDGLVATLIAAARLHVEGTTALATINQSWRVVLDAWPECREVRLPVGPLLSLSAVTVFDGEGEPHELELAQFELDAATPRVLWPAAVEGASPRERQGIEIDYVAGFGEAPEDVPADLRQAMLTLVAYWFEHRDAVIVAGSGSVVPAGFDRLGANHRQVRL